MAFPRFFACHLALFTAALGSGPLARALEWEKPAIAIAIPVGTREVSVHYPFKNTSARSVHIVEIKTSCGCTVAAARSPDVAPGARGVIDAVFTAGNRRGKQKKTISVLTDEAASPVELALEVTIGDSQANERK